MVVNWGRRGRQVQPGIALQWQSGHGAFAAGATSVAVVGAGRRSYLPMGYRDELEKQQRIQADDEDLLLLMLTLKG